jgi:hypothetical protein
VKTEFASLLNESAAKAAKSVTLKASSEQLLNEFQDQDSPLA